MNAFSIFGRLLLDDKDYQQGLRAAEGETTKAATRMAESWKKVGESLQQTGKNLSLYVTAPIVGMGTAFVMAASDAEETVSKFNTVFRSLGDDADRIADKFADSFGLSSTNARRFLSDTGDLLTGFGFTADAALGLAEEVNSLAIDLASFTNFSGGAEGASQALTKALLGETESAKSLGIVISQELVQARVEELRASGQLLDATDQQARAYATLQIAQEQSFNAIGDYARTTDSFANQTRRLAQEWNEVAVTFGTVLLPIVTDVITRLGDLARAASELDAGTVRLIATIAGIAAAVGPAVLFVGRLVTGYGQLLLVLPRITASFAALRTVMLAMFAPPTGLFLLAAAGVVALGVALFGNRDSMSAKIDAAVERTRELARTLGDVNDQESLAKGVNTLADMIGPEGSEGRTAFVNYANQIVATSNTASEAFALIQRRAFETANAVELSAAQLQRSQILYAMSLSDFIEDPRPLINSLQGTIADLEARQAEFVEQLNDPNLSTSEWEALETRLDGVGSQLQQVRDRLWEAQNDLNRFNAERIQREAQGLEARLAAVDEKIAILSGTSAELGRGFEAIPPPAANTGDALKNTGDAADEAAQEFHRLSLAAIDAELSALRLQQSLATTAEARFDLQRQIEELQALREEMVRAFTLEEEGAVDIPIPAVRAIVEAARDILPAVSVELRSTADAASFMADRYLAGVAAADELTNASIESRNELLAMESASMGASAGVNDWFDATLRATDAANAMEAGLAGSNQELRQTPIEALASATALLEFYRVQERLGRATEDDVNRALLNQANALKAVMSNVHPLSTAYENAGNALANIYDGLRSNETALLEQMSKVAENSDEWNELEIQLERIRALMDALGLSTGGPPAPVAEAETTITEGINSFRSYLDQVGGNVGLFGNALLDVVSKFPLVTSALEGFWAEVKESGEIIDQGFNPLKAITAMFVELLTGMESFQDLVRFVTSGLQEFAEAAIGPIVDIFLELFTALQPLIQVAGEVVRFALQPLVWIWQNVLGPILTGIANAIKAVWNALARVIPGMRPIKEPAKNQPDVESGKPDYATGGAYVQIDPATGRARISESSLGVSGATAPVGSIQNMRQQIQALQQLYQNTLDPRERALAALWIERFEARIKEAEVLGPGAAAEEERRRREQQQAERDRRDAEEERRRRAEEGQPPTPSPAPTPSAPPPPPGTIAALEEERRALQAQLNVASAAEIPALNLRISELGEEINRLRRLGLDEPDSPVAEAIKDVLEPFSFGGTPQSVQLAVATPLVEASERMLDAANVMNTVFGSMLPGQEAGFGALPPFTSAIERMTPVLERLLEEGVSVMMRQAQSGPMASPTAFLRGV